MLRVTLRMLVLACAATMAVACGASGARFQAPKVAAGTAPLPVTVLVTPFEDSRGYEQEPARIKSAPPLSFYRGFRFERPDMAYTESAKSFAERGAEELAKDLQDSGMFQKVVYAKLDKVPEKGTYDLHLKGELLKATQSGGIYLYGLVLPLGVYFYDVAWYLGLPRTRRDYEVHTKLQWYNGYDDKPIGDPVESQYETPGKTFWVYGSEGKLNDLSKRLRPAWNDLVADAEADFPDASDSHWADLKSAGQAHLAAVAREAEFIRKGSPPVFTFISPATGTNVRTPRADINWTISAPNALKSASLSVGGKNVDLQLTDLGNESTAPRAVSSRITSVGLDLGTNAIKAKVADWRGNETEADLSISRLPAVLRPEARHALIVGLGSTEAEATARALDGNQSNPLAGQFEARRVTVVADDSFDGARLRESLASFGRSPVRGELAFVYIAAPADAETMSVGTGSSAVPVREVVETLRKSLATDDVFLVLDLDWSASKNADVSGELRDAPSRWGVVVSNQSPAPVAKKSGLFLYGSSLADVFVDRSGTGSLTVERLFDDLNDSVAQASDMEPEISGRFDPNVTMVSYE